MCKICNKKHNTLLHHEKGTENGNSNIEADRSKETSITNNLSVNCGVIDSKQVMLSTAIVKIKDKHGHFQNCRALLDCGSEGSFITKELCDKLGLIKEGISVNVMGINQNVSTIKHRVALEIESMQFPYKSTISCFVLT
ncbi:hypothetical protein QE152_g29209 [Popillia japonica]|uniref:Peptidase aspartic putative domain-containing protein n=1 Tax=Popillia japonica TaxID=7064 RepID=A0AAW1JID7_POPJA